jgi:hypothetical protein
MAKSIAQQWQENKLMILVTIGVGLLSQLPWIVGILAGLTGWPLAVVLAACPIGIALLGIMIFLSSRTARRASPDWEGHLIQARDTPQVYFVRNGTKHHLQEWRWAEPFGLDIKDLHTIPQAQVIFLPDGPSITSAEEMKKYV